MVLRIIVCVSVGLIGLVGLFLAARTHESALYEAGLIMTLFSVFFIFWQIKRGYDSESGKTERIPQDN